MKRIIMTIALAAAVGLGSAAFAQDVNTGATPPAPPELNGVPGDRPQMPEMKQMDENGERPAGVPGVEPKPENCSGQCADKPEGAPGKPEGAPEGGPGPKPEGAPGKSQE